MKKCNRCRKQFDDALFLCPHCGAIYGDPDIKNKRSLPFKPLRAWQKRLFVAIAVLVAMIAVGMPVATFLFSMWDAPASTTIPSTMPAKQYRYVMQVTDVNGEPIPSAQVIFSRNIAIHTSAGQNYAATTNVEGLAECILSDAGVLYAWVASAPEEYDLTAEVMALYPQEGSQKPIALSLPYQNRNPFTIHVVDSDGNPVPGISYRYGILQIGLEMTGETDANGCIYIPREAYDDLSQFYISILSVPSIYDPAAVGTYLPEAGDQDYTITLPPKPKVVYTVTVMDTNGNPMKDVGVALVEYDGKLGHFPEKELNDCPIATTDENGYCEFVMDDEGNYAAQLCFFPTGFLANSTFVRFDGYFNATVTVSDWSFNNAFSNMCMLTVKIVDQDGNPLPWAYLTFEAYAGMMGMWAERYSNLDGYLTFWCDPNSKGTITAKIGAVTIERSFDTNIDADTTIVFMFYNESDAPVMPILDIE